MSLYCDKDCQNVTTICIVLIFASLLTGYIYTNQTIKTWCIMLAIVLLLYLIILQNDGYYEYLQPPCSEDIQIINNLKQKLIGVIPQEILESTQIVPYTESYTYRKKKIYLCLGKEYKFDENTLIYVLIHEFSHVMCPPHPNPHNDEWQSIFSKHLKIAEEKGVHNPKIPFNKKYLEICSSKN